MDGVVGSGGGVAPDRGSAETPSSSSSSVLPRWLVGAGEVAATDRAGTVRAAPEPRSVGARCVVCTWCSLAATFEIVLDAAPSGTRR